jgi:hypothetical protein
MLRDIEKLKLKSKVLDNCCVIWSLWEGYKEEPEYKQFLDKMEELDIDIITCHTSRTRRLYSLKTSNRYNQTKHCSSYSYRKQRTE